MVLIPCNKEVNYSLGDEGVEDAVACGFPLKPNFFDHSIFIDFQLSL